MDWLRALASLWVVLFHLNEPIPYVPNVYTAFCKLGWLGVPVFFAISGWCMAGLVSRMRQPVRFLLARWLRLYPPYLASLLVTLAVVLGIKLVSGVNDVTRLPQSTEALLATVLMATKPVTGVTPMNWSYWTLPVEFAFYTLTALVLLLAVARGGRTAAIGMASILALSVLMNVARLPLQSSPFFWCSGFPLFAAGWYAQGLHDANRVRSALLGTLLALLAVVAGRPLDPHLWWSALAAAATVLLLWLGPRPEWQRLAATPAGAGLRHLGLISYSVYLLHVPIGCYLLSRLRPPALLVHWPAHLLFDVGVLVVIVAVATGFHRLVEQPSHRWSRQVGR
jgi:peptidoglycan/LPS O-acetylase OafA/YrhL